MRAMAAVGTLAAVAGLAIGQGERPALRALETAIDVAPLRAAPAAFERGEVVRVGEWMELSPARARHDVCRDYRVFDCYGDADWDGYPDDAGGCQLGSSRWHFGSAYCNNFYSNDMTLVDDAILGEGAWRFDVAWYWTGPGAGFEQCVMLIFTQTSNPDECEDDTFDYPAWLIDFGALECNPGAYYYALIDISLIGRWELPPSGTGSYGTMYLTEDGGIPATCAQPMLWGTSDGGGTPNGPGTQGPGQLDDDNPGDGQHQSAECYTYSFGSCPDPLGAMAQIWGERLDPPGNRADFNGDGEADTRDFIAFLQAWGLCEERSDCNGNGRCDSADVLCYLDLWATCRG